LKGILDALVQRVKREKRDSRSISRHRRRAVDLDGRNLRDRQSVAVSGESCGASSSQAIAGNARAAAPWRCHTET
jgi:hypothetical protein